jgi:hypothetical protein
MSKNWPPKAYHLLTPEELQHKIPVPLEHIPQVLEALREIFRKFGYAGVISYDEEAGRLVFDPPYGST